MKSDVALIEQRMCLMFGQGHEIVLAIWSGIVIAFGYRPIHCARPNALLCIYPMMAICHPM